MNSYAILLLIIPMTILMVNKAHAQLCFDALMNVCNGVSTTSLVQGGKTSAWSGTEADLTTVSNSLAGKYNTPTGSVGQYVRGDGSLGTSPVPVVKTFTTPTRSLNTAFQISTTQDMDASYAVDVNVTSPLLAGTQGTVFLEYADNSAMTTNLVIIMSGTGAISGVLSLNNTGSISLHGIIPAGKWVRLRTVNTTGTPTFTYRSAQEVSF